MSQTLLEKLQLKDEKSLLIQGLPSSIEKQFAKLAFAKNVTPLLRNKKINFALVFAVNEVQLRAIINEVLPALHEEGKLWVAYPKSSSKIATTLHRDCSWRCITEEGYEGVSEVTLDNVRNVQHLRKSEKIGLRHRASAGHPRVANVIGDITNGSDAENGLMQLTNAAKRRRLAASSFDRHAAGKKNDYSSGFMIPKPTGRSSCLGSGLEK
jgi:hypothetical protein